MAGVRRAWRFVRRSLRAAKMLATDKRVPKWLRVLFVIGCVQIPVLPVDEIALLAAVAIMAVWYRPLLSDVWARSSR